MDPMLSVYFMNVKIRIQIPYTNKPLISGSDLFYKVYAT